MQPTHECRVSTRPDGVITVDGVAYPMAESIVATESAIQRRLRAVAAQIAADYAGATHRDTFFQNNNNNNSSNSDSADAAAEVPISMENPLIILSILKGSYIFTADLVRYLNDCGVPHVVDFFRCTSYNDGTQTTGTVQLLAEPKFQHLRGKHVLVVEDVCDSGVTLRHMLGLIQRRYRPKSLRVCVLAHKTRDARKVQSIWPPGVCRDLRGAGACARNNNNNHNNNSNNNNDKNNISKSSFSASASASSFASPRTSNHSNNSESTNTTTEGGEVDYAVLRAPNKYIVGYGFEVNDRYRPFRHVFVLKEGEGKRYPAKL